MNPLWLFFAVFLAGPFLFQIGLREAIKIDSQLILPSLIAIMFSVGLGLRLAARVSEAGFEPLILATLLSFWLCWITILIMGARAFFRLDPSGTMRRSISIIGAIGTTMPWFGYAWAQMMASV